MKGSSDEEDQLASENLTNICDFQIQPLTQLPAAQAKLGVFFCSPPVKYNSTAFFFFLLCLSPFNTQNGKKLDLDWNP